MNIKSLTVGMVIKNYKLMCEVLEIKVTSGASKQAQIKEMQRYFRFHKEGNKFVIDEIFPTKKASVDKRHVNKGGSYNVTDYTKTIEKLILNLLVQDGNKSGLGFGRVFLSKNQLLTEFKMINQNYVFCKRRMMKLSKFLNIQQETIDEWYSCSNDMLERNLEYALKSLENQCLITWTKEITVVEMIPMAEIIEDGTRIIKHTTIDNYGDEIVDYTYYADKTVKSNYREGTDKEKVFIVATELKIMSELKCDGKQMVIKMGMWDVFKEKVDAIVLKELNIAFYYKSYKILFDETNVENVVDDMYEEFEISKDDLINKKKSLNGDIVCRLNYNIEKRYGNAVEEISTIMGTPNDTFKHNRLIRRSSENYISDNSKLTKSLIELGYKNIKDNVKKTKITIDNSEADKMMDELFGKLDN